MAQVTWIDEKLAGLLDTLDSVFEQAARKRRPTSEIADRMAELRLSRGDR